MDKLVPEHAYVITKRKTGSLSLSHVPTDYLKKLADLCTTFGANDLHTNFLRHAGENASYSMKNELQAGLKEIYLRITATGNDALDSNTKAAITAKLLEGVENCTPGFHDRVNDILNAFTLPKSINELLYQYRYALVENEARKMTDEVHAHNRFFVLASTLGYGIVPPNNKDIYTGNISDSTITKILEQTFSTQYTPWATFHALREQIKATLHTQFDYKGKNASGYKAAEYEKILNYLKEVLGQNNGYELFILDDNSNIIDIDWEKLNSLLFKNLFPDSGMKQPFNLTDTERQILRYLLDPTCNDMPHSFTPLFGQQGMIKTSEELLTLVIKMDNNSIKQYHLVIAFIETLPKEKRLLELYKIAQELKNHDLNPMLILYVKNNTLKEKHFLFPNKKNRLIEDLEARKDVHFLLLYLEEIDNSSLSTLLTVRSIDKGYNALMTSARYNPTAVGPILEAMKNLTPWQQTGILAQKDPSYNANALMLATAFNPTAVGPILEAMKILTHAQQKEILKPTFGLNALMFAEKYNSTAIGPIEEAMMNLKKIDAVFDRLSRCKFGSNDILMDEFIESKRIEMDKLPPEERTIVLESLKNIASELEKDGGIIQSIRTTIQEFRSKAGIFTVGMNKKANALEKAMSMVPIEDRLNFISKGKNKDGPVNAVYEAMASHRHFWHSKDAHKKNGILDATNAGNTFKKFKQEFMDGKKTDLKEPEINPFKGKRQKL